MTDASDGRALELAERFGVVQEARRLGYRLVGTEHLLMAALSDPVVRSALSGFGCDMRDVQRLVTRATQHRVRRVVTGTELTPEAAALMTRATAAFGDVDLAHRPDPRFFSAVLGTVMIMLLRGEQDTAAGRILDELDVRRHATDLVKAIERDAGPSVLPRAERVTRADRA